MTITAEQIERISQTLAGMELPVGLGDEHNACSIAAINLALSGELTDEIPDCMSTVVGRWIIGVQDAMPSTLRNSPEWKGLLPLAAGTGRERENERLAIILDWMWATVLPTLQGLADDRGFGGPWRAMCSERTSDAAYAAAYAAAQAAAQAAADAAAQAAAYAAADAAAYAAAHAAAQAAAWQAFDPCGLLKRLVEVSK